MNRTPLGTVFPLAAVCGQPILFTQEKRSFSQRLVSADDTYYISLCQCADDAIPRLWRFEIVATGAGLLDNLRARASDD